MHGDSIFRCLYADTQKELTAKLRQSIDSYQGTDLTEQSRMTLSEWLEQRLGNMSDTLWPNIVRNYRSYIENHIRPSLGDKRYTENLPHSLSRRWRRADCRRY